MMEGFTLQNCTLPSPRGPCSQSKASAEFSFLLGLSPAFGQLLVQCGPDRLIRHNREFWRVSVRGIIKAIIREGNSIILLHGLKVISALEICRLHSAIEGKIGRVRGVVKGTSKVIPSPTTRTKPFTVRSRCGLAKPEFRCNRLAGIMNCWVGWLGKIYCINVIGGLISSWNHPKIISSVTARVEIFQRAVLCRGTQNIVHHLSNGIVCGSALHSRPMEIQRVRRVRERSWH